jgi:hypothetical protein
LKFKKKEIESTLFAGNKALKLVLPCQLASDKNTLIRKEYLCYRFCEELSSYYFKTRLATLTLTDVSRKKPRTYELLTFFVEDNGAVAKRSNGKIVESKALSPKVFDEKQAIRNDYIQYMIGNADWSAVYQHNANVLFADGKYITLSYDFDMAGFVDAAYARENPPQLGTGDPLERVYRGFCKSREAMQAIRLEFLEKEKKIQSLIDAESQNFTKYALKDMHDYIGQFFEILRNDHQFKVSILEGCRVK